MYLRCLSVAFAAAIPLLAAQQTVLRVCADPNNLPYSNERQQGFENKLAELVAQQMGAKLEYTWWSQRKSFVKNSLDAGRCDLLMGVPTSLASVEPTKPYYRSTYVFASRHDRDLRITSLNDPRFEQWRVGVHVVDDNLAPPAAALARRGITANVTGFSLFGPYGEPNPPRKLIDAVANGTIDVAIVWGPFAGYFAQQESVPLDIVPVSPATFLAVPFTFEISAGVRKGDLGLKNRVDGVLTAQAPAIREILAEYGVPQVE